MRAVFSTTFDDQYLFYVPITAWCWHKLGIEPTLIMPDPKQATVLESKKAVLIGRTLQKQFGDGDNESVQFFKCPKNKEATYAQVARLYAGALVFPKKEVLITTDVDMLVFKNIFEHAGDSLNVFGADLVPAGQLPMCYAYGTAKVWRDIMNIGVKSFQECLDEQLAKEECENMRGNLWCRDQELLYKHCLNSTKSNYLDRARPGTQFAMNRIDRDDSFFMDRLDQNIIDYHMHRPGYTPENFQKIMGVIQYFYPGEALAWMMDYRNQYAQLV